MSCFEVNEEKVPNRAMSFGFSPYLKRVIWSDIGHTLLSNNIFLIHSLSLAGNSSMATTANSQTKIGRGPIWIETLDATNSSIKSI